MERERRMYIYTEQEWEEEEKLRRKYAIGYDRTPIYFCKLESHRLHLYGTLRLPPKQENEVGKSFRFYLADGQLIFVDNGSMVRDQLKRLAEEKLNGDSSPARILYELFVGLVEEDLLFLQGIERKIAGIEEQVLKNCCPKFNVRMLQLKKKIAEFCRYYSQLSCLAQELLDNETELFDEAELPLFGRYRDRIERLGAETQMLRDYAMQVQDVYQSEIEIRQNDVMKMLTVVTTICLPLTLIAGWYGMNFAYMPELGMRYAYPVVIGISIFIVMFSLILFKKKRYW